MLIMLRYSIYVSPATGGIVLSGGLICFIFSRNTESLMTGGLYGGALLALSILSLKFWKQGQSSTPL
ncbi:putative TMEM14 family protein [Helianthus anomalus]